MQDNKDATIQHLNALIKAVERQRNDVLTREAQKDALVSILQEQSRSFKAAMDQLQEENATLKAAVEGLRSEISQPDEQEAA